MEFLFFILFTFILEFSFILKMFMYTRLEKLQRSDVQLSERLVPLSIMGDPIESRLEVTGSIGSVRLEILLEVYL